MESKYLKGGAVLVVLAVLALGVAILWKGSSTPTCGLTTAAAAALVTGATHGKDVAEILAPAIAGVAVPPACKSVVDTLVNKPETPVLLKLQLPDGTQTTTELTRSQLPSARTGGTSLGCSSWRLPALRTMCEQGQLPPPKSP